NFLFVLGTLSQNPGLDASVTPAWAERADQGQETKAPGLRPNNGEDVVEGAQLIKLSSEGAALPATAMTQQGKIAAALSKAGISNPAAWTAAGVGVKTARSEPVISSVQAVSVETAVVAEPQADSGETEGFDLHPPVVLMQGSHQPAFFISWRSQRDVVKLLGWKSDLMIWGGPALTLVCIYFLLAHFDWL